MTMSHLPDYQQRVVIEQQELCEKIDKLTGFINSDKFAEVPSDEQQRLHAQLVIMRSYKKILAERISVFCHQTVDPGPD